MLARRSQLENPPAREWAKRWVGVGCSLDVGGVPFSLSESSKWSCFFMPKRVGEARERRGIDAHRWRLEALSSDGRGRKWVGVNIDIHRDVDRWACKVLGVARESPLPPLVHFIIIIETAPLA